MSIVLSALILSLVVCLHELGHLIAARATGTTVDQFGIGFGKPLIKLWVERPEEQSDPKIDGVQFQLYLWNLEYEFDVLRSSLFYRLLTPVVFLMGSTKWCLGTIPFGGYVKMSRIHSPWKETIVSFAGPAANFLTVFVIAVYTSVTLHHLGFVEAIFQAILWCGHVAVLVFEEIQKIFQHKTALEVSGPVGIIKEGTDSTPLKFLFLISLSLGVMNLFPIPPLDGGRIVFTWFKALLPRVGAWTEQAVEVTGTVGLVVFMIYATYNDILSFF